ncbi:MAG: hypothetical protein KAT46_01330 [Deltaproteobacteria bacterium]|nr:hypothetical protein [Deltaproteobacteria bacterium]
MEKYKEVEVRGGALHGVFLKWPKMKKVEDEIFHGITVEVEKIFSDYDGSRIIKDGTTTSIAVVSGGFGLGFDICVKRFKRKGVIREFFKKFSKGKAKGLFEKTLELIKRELPLPEPIGFLEPNKGKGESYFFSRAIKNSENLAVLYKDGEFNEAPDFAEILARATANLYKGGVRHGDLKWSNILVTGIGGGGEEIYFVDMDQAEVFETLEKIPLKCIKKDLIRFYRYALELSEVRPGAEDWTANIFFPILFRELGAEVSTKLDIDEIGDLAKKAFKVSQ